MVVGSKLAWSNNCFKIEHLSCCFLLLALVIDLKFIVSEMVDTIR